MKKLIDFLNRIAPMSKDLEKHLGSIAQFQEYKKGQLLLTAGEACNPVFYIQKGLIACYRLVKKQEVTDFFMKEGELYLPAIRLLQHSASNEYIIALEPVEIWMITYAQLINTYQKYPEFVFHGLAITSDLCCHSIKRDKLIRRTLPIDRYTELITSDPDLARRVTNVRLASFLNVGDRTLSMIRKEFSKRKKTPPSQDRTD